MEIKDSLGKAVEVRCSHSRLPANGRSYTTLRLRFTAAAGELVELRLSGRGSFDPHIRRRRISVPVVNGEATVHIHAPRWPGACTVHGPGCMHRLEFTPASTLQGVVSEWVPAISLALVFALVLRTYAFAGYYIPSESMRDTMKVGDLFITENFTYRVLNQDPERGDIVVFRHPQDSRTLIKRVIGLPGDTVEIRDGTVYINNIALQEEYIRSQPLLDFPVQAVPAGSYFVMGDNRIASSDSRAWGLLPRENLLGRAAFVFWPPKRMHVVQREGYVTAPD